MSSIFINGVQYGDSTKWMDLLSRPTINTHLVEKENTSTDLDIFKYITLDDFKDLLKDPLELGDHINPYCVYAVDDETNNIQRIYFSNGKELYVYNDYSLVNELIEDSTLLQYLKEDTTSHSKGLWGYLENSTTPGTFEFVKIESIFDNKTIKSNGQMVHAQKGGYISGKTIVLDKIINNLNPNSVIIDSGKTILSFDSMPYNYTPNSKYEITVTWGGATNSQLITPYGITGNDILDFSGTNTIIKLDSTHYPSTTPTDYLVTLTWFKPSDISYINPLYINVDSNVISLTEEGKLCIKNMWVLNRFSTTDIDPSQNEILEEIYTNVILGTEMGRIVYDNSELFYTNEHTSTDNKGAFFSFATNLDENIEQVQIRVYMDTTSTPYTVIGAQEYSVKLITFGTEPAPTTLLHNTIFATPIAP